MCLSAAAQNSVSTATIDSTNAQIPSTDTVFTMPVHKTLADWEKRKTQLRKQILNAAGLYPLPARQPMRSLVFGRIEHKDYSIEKVALETMPGYWLGANLYRPVGKGPRRPAIVSPHGHWVYGRLEHQQLASVPARGITLAKLGFVVLSYDMVGFNDTMQTPHAFGDDRRDQLWSFGPLGLQLWNSIRAVDFLTQLADVDPDRIGATGASGGATQILMLAAVDDRIRFSAPVNMISSIMQGGSPCENAPGLRIGTNNMEIGAMMAPRPMLMISATGDWTRNTPNVEFPAVRSIYELYDARVRLETRQIDAPHNYNLESREAVYRFFARTVLHAPNPEQIKEGGVRIEKLSDMLVWHGRTLPDAALDFAGVRRSWIEMGKAQTNAAEGKPDLEKERLALTLSAEWPSEVKSAPGTQADSGYLSRTNEARRIAYLILGSGAPTHLVVGEAGIDSALGSQEVQQLRKQGESVLLIGAFNTGSAKSTRDVSERHFLTFNKSDDAERVQDILTAIRWMQQRGATHIRVSGLQKAAVWATYAAAVAPVRVQLTSRPVFEDSEDGFARDFFVPGILRAGGWKLAVRLAGL
ncbi:MAG: hypothetical protein H7039_21015 [Bryobacteraceae bacterium]|nr:hypothetical protein [Bryobacteraceae bacterium]